MGALEAMNRESLTNAWCVLDPQKAVTTTNPYSHSEVGMNSSILQTKKWKFYFTLDFYWPNSPTCPPLELLRTPALPHGTPGRSTVKSALKHYPLHAPATRIHRAPLFPRFPGPGLGVSCEPPPAPPQSTLSGPISKS